MTANDLPDLSKRTSGVYEVPTVTLPWAAAFFLCRELPVERLAREVRGAQPTLDRAFRDLLLAAQLFSDGRGASDSGSSRAPAAEAPPSSIYDDEIGTGEAADLLAITDRAVRLALKAGRLPGRYVDGRWRLRRRDVLARVA